MRQSRVTTLTPYVVALASVCVATTIRLLLDPILGDRFPFATLFAGILFSAWFGGFAPALFAALLGGLAASWYLLPAEVLLVVRAENPAAGLALYGSVSLGIALFGGAMHRARRMAEADALRFAEQGEQLRVTLESIGDAVITTDIHGRITSMNKTATQLTGWDVADATGRSFDAVFKTIDEDTGKPPGLSPVQRVLSEGRAVDLAPQTLIARSGNVRPIDDSIAPIRNRAGEVIGVVLVFRDLTERRLADERLRRSDQELNDLFENANVGLSLVGADGIVLRVNQAELDLLGYQRDEYVGHQVAEFYVDRGVIEDVLRRLLAGQSIPGYPARLRCKDGSVKEVLIKPSVRWEDGQFVHMRCFTLDVTMLRRAEEAQALLAAVVESSEDAIITKTLDGVITSWNAAAERLFGYQASEAIGRSITMIIPPERYAEERMIVQRLRAGERVEHFETVRVKKDGTSFDISVAISPVRDARGRVIGASKVARDITASKRAEQAVRASEERFRALTSNAPAVIFIKDLEGRYTLANPLACEALGAVETCIGLTDHELLPAPIADKLRRRDLEVIAAGRAIESEEVVSRPGYERRFLSVKFPLFEADRPVGVCGVAIDITARKHAEEALLAADRRKDVFLATLAHELRNPLAPMRNSVEIMKVPEGDPALLARARATMDRQLTHLERLVDDLVDIARISHDQLELRRERVDLRSIVHDAVEICRPLTVVRQIELTVAAGSDPVYLDADPVRLTQVLSNLLNNSCKYTASGGRIWVSCRREGRDAACSVRDTGIGIPTEMLSSIFDMFTQLDQPPEQLRSGLGIGLTLVQRLVEMHGGTVEARSEGPWCGSEFIVRVPALANAAEGIEAPPTPAAKPFVHRRILVVDDNADAAESLATLLEMAGHTTLVAHDGDEALAAAETLRPDIVLLDIGLPRMSGHDVARRIRAEAWGEGMILVALTGWGQEEDRRRSREVGFDHHLVKPVQLGLLMQLLGSDEIRSGGGEHP